MFTVITFQNWFIEVEDRKVRTVPWDMDRKRKSYQYTIRVSLNTPDGYGSFEVFEYTSSIADYEEGIDELTEQELLLAFWCICQDAVCTLEGPEQFGYDYGYNEVPFHEALRVWNACLKTKEKLDFLKVPYESYQWMEELRELVDP